MKKMTLSRASLYLCILSVAGCANTEEIVERRASGDSIEIAGGNYATSTDNEDNVFGKENKGLANNPKTKPSKDMLGEKGQYDDLKLSIEPDNAKTFINQIIEFTVEISPEADRHANKPQFVIVLERAAGANGSLIVDSESLYDADKFPPTETRAVITPRTDYSFTFRVQTGTSYNSKTPMYYVNVWHADAEEDAQPLEAKIIVRKPPQMSDGYEEGTLDVDNDLTVPDGLKDSKLSTAVFTNLDELDQQLFVDDEKRLRVELSGKCADTAPGKKDEEPSTEDGESTEDEADDSCVGNETVCWTFVETSEKNKGFVSQDSDKKYTDNKQFADKKNKRGKNTGCGKTDSNGIFWAEVSTSSTYNSKYYLNFFHKVAAPLTYDIRTFVMPDTLGDPGDEALLSDDALKTDLSEAKPNADGRNELSGCAAAKVLKGIFYSDDDKVKISIEDQCGDMDKCSGKDSCSADSFRCKMVQNSDKTWSVQSCEGKQLMTDINDDKTNDPIRLVMGEDSEGNTYFQGYDINYDGKVEVAPDPCLYSKYKDICKKAKYSFVCSTDNKKTFRTCSTVSAKLDEDVTIYVKKLDNNGKENADGEIQVEIQRGALATNNAMLKDENGKLVESVKISASKKIYNIEAWAGTGYDALYYLETTADETKPVLIPLRIINSISIPTAKGDKADPDDPSIYTPPADIEPYIPDIGKVTLSVASGSATITSPVVKTLNLQVLVRKDNKSKTLVPDTKTWWKVTRGKSVNNNATLTASTAMTNSKGVASDAFYTGTGYDSVYFVSVFHPNYLDEENKPKPFVFQITTTNDTGALESDLPADPSRPEGDTIQEDGTVCEGNCEGNLKQVDGKATNPKYPQGVGCDERECSCNASDKAKCSQEGGEVPACCPSMQMNADKKQGCLELIFEGEDVIQTGVGYTISVKVRLVWRNGSEVTPIRDTIYWTLDGNKDADGALLSSSSGSDKNGYANVLFKTGSKATTYRINAMYPNIHKDGHMVPKSIMVNVKGTLDDKTESSDVNNITLKANTSNIPKIEFDSVSYYALPADLYDCSEKFFLAEKDARQEACGEYKTTTGGKNFCNLTGSKKEDSYKATATAPTADKYTIFAIANKGNSPVAYGCEPYISFSSSTVPKECDDDNATFKIDKDGTEKKTCKPVRELVSTVSLSEIPTVIQPLYNTKTMVNLGPLMGNDSEIGQALQKLTDTYAKFVGTNPGDKIIDTLTKSIVYTGKDTGTPDADDCITFFYDKNPEKCRYKNNSGKLTHISSCSDWSDSSVKENDKAFYTNCNCMCADLYYWTAVNSIGKKLAPLAQKLLKSLINKYLSPDALQSKLCEVFDGLQFVTLVGKMSLEEKDGKYVGSARYSGAMIPYVGDTAIDLEGTVIEGKWKEAKVTNGTQLSISDFTINFTYGKFLYQILGKFIGALDLKTGKVDLTKGIDCDKIFDSDINLGITSVSSDLLKGICRTALGKLGDYTADLSDKGTIPLSAKLQGTGEFAKGNTCLPDKTKIACQASVIQGGKWEGTGNLGATKADGKSDNGKINGVWIGYTDGAEEPEMKFGTKSLDEYKAENSICMQNLKSSLSEYKSNKACLLGAYSNIAKGTSGTACEKPECLDKTSIVVCTKVNGKGAVNSLYSGSSASQIIKAANEACRKQGNPSDCQANKEEIINNGEGITNSKCLETACNIPACKDNPTIFVCDKNGLISDDDSVPSSIEDEHFIAALNTICGSKERSECIKEQVKQACDGKCDLPACVMNSELTSCVDSSGKDESKPEPVSVILAEWDFGSYWNGTTADDEGLNSDLSSNIIAKAGIKQSDFALIYDCPKYPVKLVAGSDSALNAVGTKVVSGSETNCLFMISNSTSNRNYEITKVEAKVYGDGRVINYRTIDDGPKSIDVKEESSLIAPEGEWVTKSVEFKTTGRAFTKFKFWPTAAKGSSDNADAYKMLRFDDIRVYGFEK